MYLLQITAIAFCEVNRYIGTILNFDVSDKVVKYFNAPNAEQRTPEVAAAAGTKSRGRPRLALAHVASGAKMVLNAYGLSYPAIESALHGVAELCKEAEKTHVVDHDDVKKLSPDQVIDYCSRYSGNCNW